MSAGVIILGRSNQVKEVIMAFPDERSPSFLPSCSLIILFPLYCFFLQSLLSQNDEDCFDTTSSSPSSISPSSFVVTPYHCLSFGILLVTNYHLVDRLWLFAIICASIDSLRSIYFSFRWRFVALVRRCIHRNSVTWAHKRAHSSPSMRTRVMCTYHTAPTRALTTSDYRGN
jgi:hypothetical protein